MLLQAAFPVPLPEQHTQVSTAGAFFVVSLVRCSLLIAGVVPSPQVDECGGNELTFADKGEKKFEKTHSADLQQWMQDKC